MHLAGRHLMEHCALHAFAAVAVLGARVHGSLSGGRLFRVESGWLAGRSTDRGVASQPARIGRVNDRFIGRGRAASSTACPIVENKNYGAPSVFEPQALLREARRQKGLPVIDAPAVCVLDPDGDTVRHLRRTGAARPSRGWACYHTEMFEFDLEGRAVGIVGCAVGAPFAVLAAEQLFASGCRLLISITSAGQIIHSGPPPYFIAIDRALRDEGTSYHYLPPSEFVDANTELVSLAEESVRAAGLTIHRGATWTTDAPFRETADAIAAARAHGALAVEMEAAALYAFSAARNVPVICYAHVTNTMGQVHGDFEKGEADGSASALEVIAATAMACLRDPTVT
jgi:uridine phosphorylase